MEIKKIVLAFSGGLDTSFCTQYLKEEYKSKVITVTVDTGGFSKEELSKISAASKKLGAEKHYEINSKKEFFDNFITYIIKGNMLRGGNYPLSVSAERVVQAQKIAEIAVKEKADAIAHGSTGAGNDQARFDIAFRVLSPNLKIIAPVRELSITREKEAEYLEKKGFPIGAKKKGYSINQGMWGTTIGGKETHDAWQEPPEGIFTKTQSVEKAPASPEYTTIDFAKGIPVKLNGKKLSGVSLIKELDGIASKHGIGRGIHIGDTILGIKGRIAFEAGAPLILIRAHKEIEKLVLTKWQAFWKNQLSEFYGNLLHEGMYFEPVMRDIEKMIDSSQERVTGTAKIKLHKGSFMVVGCKSKFSMMNLEVATYGESNLFYDGRDAEGFSKIYGLQSILAHMKK
ncbi:argininosuccinate synthase [Candidatus Woesearchaeota archaeon]|nr:argininosuccinate synthase [Candidatus Woesearchaeota archaeon]